jgi:threonine dehydratase
LKAVSATVYVASSRDKTYVSPYNGLHVVAGYGTLGADRYNNYTAKRR